MTASGVLPHQARQEDGIRLDVYKQTVLNQFAFFKNTERMDDLWVKNIPLESGRGYLLPVSRIHEQDRALIETLAKWREENTFAFPSRFPVTVEGTASWLTGKLLDVEDRLLFLVVDSTGKPLGHLGLANALNDECQVEIDNVVRGDKEALPGIFSEAMRAMLRWADELLVPNEIFLRVLSDNEHAINFYRKLGFEEARRIPLRKTEAGQSVSFDELTDGDTAEPDAYFQRMVYNPQQELSSAPADMILTAGPSLSAQETSYTYDAARHGWNRQWGKYLTRFESEFASYIGTKHAIATSSCTGALHLALLSLGVGPGDEVIVPDITWVATATAVMYVGATPVFADVDLDNWTMNPKSFESKITARTKVVIPVHLYGHPAKMDEIMEIARRHKLYVVEDAAPAIGARFADKMVGSYGDFATFSFQGAKMMVTGEGGMLVTSNDELHERALTLWDHGRDAHRQFWINEVGYKYKMSNMQAAFGLGQLEHVDSMIEAKRRIFGWYEEGLKGVDQLDLMYESPWGRSIYWMTNVMIKEDAGISRQDFCAILKDRKVDTRPAFPAISQYPFWPVKGEPQPNALRVGNQGINLPSGVRLQRSEVAYICRTIRDILS